MRKRSGIAVVCLVVAGFVAFSFCQAAAKDVITFGYSIALTGLHSAGAQGQVEAYAVWEEIVNKRGGIFVKEEGKKLPQDERDKTGCDHEYPLFELLQPY